MGFWRLMQVVVNAFRQGLAIAGALYAQAMRQPAFQQGEGRRRINRLAHQLCENGGAHIVAMHHLNPLQKICQLRRLNRMIRLPAGQMRIGLAVYLFGAHFVVRITGQFGRVGQRQGVDEP